MRYVYEMYNEYFGKGQAGLATRIAMIFIAPLLRWWDKKNVNRVHHYVAISDHVRKRILRHYGREAEIVFPPVDAERFQLSLKDEDYYLIVSALVPYKRVDLAIQTFNKNGARLIVVGKGPDEAKLQRAANSTIEFVGWKSDDELARLYAGCKALVFPGEEDFGIVPLEAMACGKPVIAYGKGGILETVQDGISGVFFPEQSVEALEEALTRAGSTHFDPQKIRERALQFSRVIYKDKMRKLIAQKIEAHFGAAR
jgi:glycosyltransferase involved in cell wall biosynthesis